MKTSLLCGNLHLAATVSLLEIELKSLNRSVSVNEMMLKQKYRQHNAYVKLTAPKDQLLVFEVTEGWEPLCKFLGKLVPDKPFPHRNIAGKGIRADVENHAIAKQAFRELKILIAMLAVVIAVILLVVFAIEDQLDL